jgi:hypothetical protein
MGREFWISYNGLNDNDMKYASILKKKPSGMSGGGMNQTIHVREIDPKRDLVFEERVKQIRKLMHDEHLRKYIHDCDHCASILTTVINFCEEITRAESVASDERNGRYSGTGENL